MILFVLSQKLFSFLRYLIFCPDFFSYVGKRIDQKTKVNFKIYDVTNGNSNNYNKCIARYLKSKGNQTMKFGQLIEAVVRRCSIKKVLLKISKNSQEKHLCQSLFFNKVAGFWSATLSKKKLQHRCFSVNFQKFLRAPFLQNISGSYFCSP